MTVPGASVPAAAPSDLSLAPGSLAAELSVILQSRTRQSTAGYPYLHRPVWLRFRDWVPHILDDGPRTLATAARVQSDLEARGVEGELAPAASVIRQVVQTAAVTAPSDLWLLRQVVSGLHSIGAAERFLADEVVRPGDLGVRLDEILVDLRLLLGRGTIVRAADGFRLADHRAARAVMAMGPVSAPADPASLVARAFCEPSDADAAATLASWLSTPLPDADREPGFWHPSARQVETGFRLVPVLVGLRLAGVTSAVADDRPDDEVLQTLSSGHDALDRALSMLWPAAGIIDDDGAPTSVARRVLTRGPGPMGIIYAYHRYLASLVDIWKKGRGAVWVERTANVLASQDANRRTFERANDALDRFCAETGFSYDVFIEHAVGRAEATRQRYERVGDDAVRYVGADLEDPAIDAALEEQAAGRLPRGMHFVRHADIGRPETLLDALRAEGIAPEGAVMMVGNGFHEVRDQTDDTMTAVFAAYEAAGLVLVFTEETALAIDDLLETAWNTYHAGFKYVHERSGQGLRPADARPPSTMDGQMPRSWSECATQAGYVRPERFCGRSRTVYPYPPPSGHNPSISVNHFLVPRRIAGALGVE